MNWLRDLFDLMYPRLCVVCGEVLVAQERCLCLSCLARLPKTGFHALPDNALEQRFWGRADVERGTAYLYYEKGTVVQEVLYALKYRGYREVGCVLGRHAGAELAAVEAFASVDVIVPVPLHPQKQRYRGYNQSEWIARGVADALKKPMETGNLVRVLPNESQTRRSAFERYENTAGIFAVRRPQALGGRHILLVDDVLTTGATMEACIEALQQTPDVKVSVFALAMAR